MAVRMLIALVSASLLVVLSGCMTEGPELSVAAVPSHGSHSVRGTPPSRALIDAPARFHAVVRMIGPHLRSRMQTSHRAGCPVRLHDLRHLRVSYVGYDGRAHLGVIVVHEQYADDLVSVFRRLFRNHWPLHHLRLVDAYDGHDGRSMSADNSSGYNCRTVVGTRTWSQHAYGAAVDLNPVENPDLTGDLVRPLAGRAFVRLDRSAGARVPRGVIRHGDVVVKAFARIGWVWGGTWSVPDYQHFAAPTRPVQDGRSGPQT